MNSGVCGTAAWQTPSPVVLRHLPGMIPATQRRSHRQTGRLRAPPRSPRSVGINQQRLAPRWMSGRSRLEPLKSGVPVGLGFAWHPEPLASGYAQGAGDHTRDSA